jgi:5-methylcytosine-specific restriction protein A
MPFHLDQALELDPSNLIALCEGSKEVNCHLFVGHLGNYKGFNPDVESDAKLWASKLAQNKQRIQGRVQK